MPYRIHPDRPLGRELERIVHEQLDRAESELSATGPERAATVHQVRKRCKKIRAVLRLARGPVDKGGHYSRENARYRNAARSLSDLRDATVLTATYDALLDHFGDSVERSRFAPQRRHFTLQLRDDDTRDAEAPGLLDAFGDQLAQGRRAVGEWTGRVRRFGDLLPGLKRSYQRGRKAMAKAYAKPSAERFHEWRKRVKYHGYHCRLLRDVWRPVLVARRDEADRLGDLLGDAHDLAMFRDRITADRCGLNDPETREALVALVDRRRKQLRAEARPLGRRLFAEKPKRLAARFRAYWRAS